MWDGTDSARAGTRGILHAPEASTTVWQRHAPWSVTTTYPESAWRTEVTVVSVRTGAEIARA